MSELMNHGIGNYPDNHCPRDDSSTIIMPGMGSRGFGKGCDGNRFDNVGPDWFHKKIVAAISARLRGEHPENQREEDKDFVFHGEDYERLIYLCQVPIRYIPAPTCSSTVGTRWDSYRSFTISAATSFQ